MGDGAESIPDAEVVGIDEGETEKGLLLVDGGSRDPEILRMRGVEEERGTGSEESDDERAGVCGGGARVEGLTGRGLGE